MIEQETERPPSGQAEHDETDWGNGHGETPDSSTQIALQLAHRVVNKFPDLGRRYQKFVGTAAVVSTVVIVLASIAVSRRLHRGESPDRIFEEITRDEIENVAKEKPKPQKKRGGFSFPKH